MARARFLVPKATTATVTPPTITGRDRWGRITSVTHERPSDTTTPDTTTPEMTTPETPPATAPEPEPEPAPMDTDTPPRAGSRPPPYKSISLPQGLQLLRS